MDEHLEYFFLKRGEQVQTVPNSVRGVCSYKSRTSIGSWWGPAREMAITGQWLSSSATKAKVWLPTPAFFNWLFISVLK